MNWLLHDTYKTEKAAKLDGDTIVKVGLSKGVMVKENKKNKQRQFELYIRTIMENKNVG